MIDKEKLLKEFIGVGSMYLSDVRRVIKNFPEEQEIDFDALWNEYEQKYSCKKSANCDNCTYPNKLYYTTICFVDFLKSKHISAQKTKQLPVKKVYHLKPEFERYSRSIGHVPCTAKYYPTVEPDKEFYDCTETPDYSKIPVGAVVCINGIYAGVVSKTIDEFKVIHLRFSVNDNANMSIYYCDIKSLEILKWPENVK